MENPLKKICKVIIKLNVSMFKKTTYMSLFAFTSLGINAIDRSIPRNIVKGTVDVILSDSSFEKKIACLIHNSTLKSLSFSSSSFKSF